MQEFSTKTIRHEFSIDGTVYWLPGVTVDDFEEVAKLATVDQVASIPVFRDLMLSRVRGGGIWGAFTRRRAAGKLNITQLMQLFSDWTGMKSGEASASLPQQSNIDAS